MRAAGKSPWGSARCMIKYRCVPGQGCHRQHITSRSQPWVRKGDNRGGKERTRAHLSATQPSQTQPASRPTAAHKKRTQAPDYNHLRSHSPRRGIAVLELYVYKYFRKEGDAGSGEGETDRRRRMRTRDWCARMLGRCALLRDGRARRSRCSA